MATIRVLVVDDSVVIRRLVSDVLAEDPAIEVIGTAVNGKSALVKVEALKPDLITMDIEMPELNGIETVRRLRASGVRTPIIMFSTLTEQGAKATLDALAAGATDYVAKPSNMGSVAKSMEMVRSALIPRIIALVPHRGPVTPRAAGAGGVLAPARVPAGAPVVRRPRTAAPRSGYRLLVVGSSTGGPEALGKFLGALPRLHVPVAVVQHMPPLFTKQLALRLDRQLPCDVVEAEHGRPLEPGSVHIAPGDHHLRIVARDGGLVTMLSQDPPENYCRPAVDVLFRSAAEANAGTVLGVVLTGMGQDGRRGAQTIVDHGGSLIVQDKDTSVVWGMPGAVATAGLAEEILPLDRIAAAVMERLAPRGASLVSGGSR